MATAYRSYIKTIPAGEEVTIDATGRFARCLASDQPDFLIGYDEESTTFFKAGMELILPAGSPAFIRIRIKNKSSSIPLNVNIGIGFGKINDDAAILSGSVATEEIIPDELTDYADQAITTATQTTVAAANASRVRVIVQNLEETGGASIRVGANAGASRGIQVTAGQAIELETRAAVNVYHAKGSNLNVAVMEVERS